MGNEQSAPYEGPTEVLEGRDVRSIVKYMKSKECRKVFVMVRVSTAAGIPDFRTPGTGMSLSNLERLNLPYPEAVFAINYFAENPLPFYTLARELYPGRFRPTLTHTFVKLLADHALLDTCFTQNIDTLERRAGVPAHRIVEAHGSFADQHCIECKRAFDGAQMKAAIERAEIVRCGQCGGLVKPDIVFFGEALPPLFERTVPKLREADLLFVIGTSLTVHPFASLTGLVPAGCPRVLINMERAGDIGGRPDDVVLLGRCDDIVREIAQELGWADELEREWAKTEILVPLEALDREKGAKEKDEGKAGAETAVADDPASQEASAEGAPAVSKAQEEEARVEAEVDVLTEKVAQALALSEDAGVEAARTATITPGSQSTRSGPGSGEASEGAAAHSSESDSRPPVGDTRSPEASIAGKEKEKL
ncbi:DHS-like NAD/FAD-binding domain-containing protein [Dichomitus squalens]|uniref:DHS-like NAD/FAD-binding domain-containing protein n=1 Tax=Dichomitus squalens TaxID=114155 RepID=A0A4Q9MI69_9APHY|nr:DHS-like NAD/FAD-binding domain-containing protein [Dichomitus squalens]